MCVLETPSILNTHSVLKKELFPLYRQMVGDEMRMGFVFDCFIQAFWNRLSNRTALDAKKANDMEKKLLMQRIRAIDRDQHDAENQRVFPSLYQYLNTEAVIRLLHKLLSEFTPPSGIEWKKRIRHRLFTKVLGMQFWEHQYFPRIEV
jgi:hypothetical protein